MKIYQSLLYVMVYLNCLVQTTLNEKINAGNQKKIMVHNTVMNLSSQNSVSKIHEGIDSTILVSTLSGSNSTMFYYIDHLGNATSPFKVSSMNSKSLLIDKPVLLINATDQTPYLIYPNENILITSSKNGQTILVAKNNMVRSKELLFFSNLMKEQGGLFGPAQLLSKEISQNYRVTGNGLDVSKLESIALQRYKARLVYLDSNRKSLSVRSFNYIKILFKYLYLGDCLFFASFSTVKMDQIPQNYLKRMLALELEFKCDSCVENFGYKIAVNQYLQFLSRHKSVEKLLTDKYRLINNSFESDTKRFLLFSLLKNPVIKQNPDYQQCFDDFLKQKEDVYSNYLKKEEDLREVNVNYELMDENGKATNWNQILKQNIGNIIYVDFWASWCLPCRKMMPYSHELKKKLSEYKISFLYISCDQSVNQWKAAIKEEGIENAENYIVTSQKTNLLKIFKINGIPRYMIIDRKGNVVDEEAKGPDKVDLQKELINLSIKK